MVTAELGACEWFVYELRRSNLIERSQLDQVVGDFLKRQPRAEAPALAEYLVEQGILSQFQAERVLSNKAAGLVLGPYVLADSIGTGSMVFLIYERLRGRPMPEQLRFAATFLGLVLIGSLMLFVIYLDVKRWLF